MHARHRGSSRVVVHHAAALRRAQFQHRLRCALDDQQRVLFGTGREHRSEPARKIERLPAGKDPALRGIRLACNQRRIERPAVAAESRGDGAETRGAGIVLAVGIEAPGQRDLGRGQRARLVGAQDGHGAEVVDRGEALDDHLAAGHAQCAARQRHRGDHRQQFRGQPDRESDGKQQRVHHRAAEHHADGEHDQHQCQRGARDHEAEFAQVALERRARLGFGQCGCCRPEHRVAPGVDDERDRLAGLRHRAAKQRIRRVVGIGAWPGALLHRVRLAGERRFAGGEGCALQDERIRRDDVAGANAQNIAGDDLLDVDLAERTVPLDLGLQRHRAAEDVRGPHGVAFLNGVEPDRERQDQDDDEPADLVAGEHRDDARNQQDQRQRLQQPAQDRVRRPLDARRCVAVRPEAVEAFGRLRCRQPRELAAQPAAKVKGGQTPETGVGAGWISPASEAPGSKASCGGRWP